MLCVLLSFWRWLDSVGNCFDFGFFVKFQKMKRRREQRYNEEEADRAETGVSAVTLMDGFDDSVAVSTSGLYTSQRQSFLFFAIGGLKRTCSSSCLVGKDPFCSHLFVLVTCS